MGVRTKGGDASTLRAMGPRDSSLLGAVFHSPVSKFYFIPVAEIKHSDQKQLKEERVYLACSSRSQPTIAGSHH